MGNSHLRREKGGGDRNPGWALAEGPEPAEPDPAPALGLVDRGRPARPALGPRPHCWGKGRGLRSAADRAGRRQRRGGRRGGQARPSSWAARLTSAPGLWSQSGQDPSQLRRGDPDTLQPLRHLRGCCYSCSYSASAARAARKPRRPGGARALSPSSHPFPRPLPLSSRSPPALLPKRRWPHREEKRRTHDRSLQREQPGRQPGRGRRSPRVRRGVVGKVR